MCFQLVERYATCRCLYTRHSIDPCKAYGQRGHYPEEKTVFIGNACPRHAKASPSSKSHKQLDDGMSVDRASGGLSHDKDPYGALKHLAYDPIKERSSYFTGSDSVAVETDTLDSTILGFLREISEMGVSPLTLSRPGPRDLAKPAIGYMLRHYAARAHAETTSNHAAKASRLIRVGAPYFGERLRALLKAAQAAKDSWPVVTEEFMAEVEDLIKSSNSKAENIDQASVGTSEKSREFMSEGQPSAGFGERMQGFGQTLSSSIGEQQELSGEVSEGKRAGEIESTGNVLNEAVLMRETLSDEESIEKASEKEDLVYERPGLEEFNWIESSTATSGKQFVDVWLESQRFVERNLERLFKLFDLWTWRHGLAVLLSHWQPIPSGRHRLYWTCVSVFA